MRSLKYFTLAAAFAAFLAIVPANAQSYRPASFVDGRSIEKQIFKKIVNLPYYGVFDHITFELNGSTVILGGEVNSLATKKQAANVVKGIAGVDRVVNNIRQLPASGFDDSIRRQALRTFANGGLGRYLSERDPEVRIIVDGGRLTLEGYVSGRGDKSMFNVLANGISGVFEVTNNLVVGKDSSR